MQKSPVFAPASRRLFRQISALGAGLLTASLASAVDYYKANNTNALNTNAAWVDLAGNALASTPGNANNSDTWTFDSRVQILTTDPVPVPPTFVLGNNLWTRDLFITNPGYPIKIVGNNSHIVTISNGGSIDLTNATQDLTLEDFGNPSTTNVGLRVPGSNAVLNLKVPSARTLTVNSRVAVQGNASVNGATVNVSGGGRVLFNRDFRPSNLNIAAGTVEMNAATGSTRNGTAATTTIGDGTAAATLIVRNTSGSINTMSSSSHPNTVTINNNATLTGAGSVAGVTTAASGSTLSPGDNGTGTLSLAALTLAAGSKIVWEASSTGADLLAVTAANGLTIDGGTLYLYNPGTTDPLTTTGEFTLISYSGTPTGGMANLVIAEETKVPGLTYTFSDTGTAIKLEVSDGVVTPIDWTSTVSGNWSAGSNWTGGVAPDAAKALARITGETGASLTAPITVALDGSRTVGKLYLDAAQPVTLAGPGTLTFDQGTGSPALFASQANHAISAPLSLLSTGLATTVDGAGVTLTLGGVVSGSGAALSKAGGGVLVLSADNTYTGTTTVAAGTLQLGVGATAGSVAGPITNNGVVRINRTGSATLAHSISGTGSVEFVGAGDITLAAANTYSGPTTLGAGTLVLAHEDALRNTTLDYTLAGGSLTVADPVTSITLGALSGDRAFPVTNTLSAPLSLTVGGNNATTDYSATSVGTGAAFTKAGSGTLTLTGDHAFAGDATIASGVLKLGAGSDFSAAALKFGTTSSSARLHLAGGNFTTTAQSEVRNGTGGVLIEDGVASFPGGIVNPYQETANLLFRVSGGTLNAASLRLERGNLSITGEPANGQDTNGLHITGGTVNIAGVLGICMTTNSSVSARMDGGALTVGGPITVGINNSGRWSVLDVNGGTLSANSAEGIYLGGAGYTSGNMAGLVKMFVRHASAVVTTPRIQFGQETVGGRSVLSMSAGSLFVGAGGLNIGSTNETFAAQLHLNGGTLGATADWSSTIPMTFDGTAILTGSDASNNPHNITLHGAASGVGGIVKNGSGTVLLTSSASDFYGPVIVQSGTLGVGGVITDNLVVAQGATFAPQGTFRTKASANVNGGLSIRYQAGASEPVGRLESDFDINLGANSTLDLSGTGVLPGPAHVLVKAAFGVTGTFASVTGIPEGFTIDYNYNDGSPMPVIALVGAGVGTPYDIWAASYSLAGADSETTADPDSDGMNNLLEYALDTDPTLGDNASAYTVARSGNNLTLTFDHAGDSSLTYVVEATNDLAASPWPESTTLPAFTAEGTYTHTDTADLSTNPRRFLRLKVTKAP